MLKSGDHVMIPCYTQDKEPQLTKRRVLVVKVDMPFLTYQDDDGSEHKLVLTTKNEESNA